MNENKAEFEGMIGSTTLKEILSAVVAVVDRGVLRISEEGITSKQVDPANVAMVSLDIKRDVFTDYNLKGGDPILFDLAKTKNLAVGIDFDKLLHILKRYNYPVNVERDVKIKINTENVQINTGYLSYNLPVISLDALQREPKLPKLEFAATVTIELEDFNLGINTADHTTGYVEIGMNSSEFFMGVEDKEDENFKFTLVIPKEDLTLFNVDRSVKSLFSADYLTSMAKGVIGRLITLEINNDYPLQIPFTITDGCEVTYLLSPRIRGD